MDIEDKVCKLVRFHGTRNPFEMIKGMNVILVKYPLKGVRGFYHYFKRNNIIYINEKLPEKEMQLVCAHELGHMFLHKAANAIFMDTRTQFNTHRYELDANKFAVELLIPNETILENVYLTSEQLSRLLGYTQDLVELRLASFQRM